MSNAALMGIDTTMPVYKIDPSTGEKTIIPDWYDYVDGKFRYQFSNPQIV